MQGLHLTADMRGCAADVPAMTDVAALREACLAAVGAVGLEAVGELFHRFASPPGAQQAPGVTGVVLLAESHLAVHTWPELAAVTLDVYVCNMGRDNTGAARGLIERLAAAFMPAELRRHELKRGELAA
jgi:S-adenosylmethionine decarboxylase